MSDIKLFQLTNGSIHELHGTSIAIEKTLQALIERHLEAFLGVRFLGTEYFTGKTHGGRIDTLGIDENGSPVIIEYKRAVNENVINQGLFYLDWLMDHKGEFELLVFKKLGKEAADAIDWSATRLLCIASDFTKYDEYAVQQINRNIELIRYRKYGDELVLFELVNAITAQASTTAQPTVKNTLVEHNGKSRGVSSYKTASDLLEQAPPDLRDRFEALKAFLLALGDDVQMKTLKFYFAFRRIKNFACVEVHPQTRHILIYVKVDPSSVQMEKGFIRDVHAIGHYGTGDVEITVQNDADMERAKPLLLQSYAAN
jgi:predicted transport protein